MGHKEGTGPTITKHHQFPPDMDLVFGAYGEASEAEGVWNLLDVMANKRLSTLGLSKGTPGGAGELAIITSQLRRLSTAVVTGHQLVRKGAFLTA